MFTDRNRCGRSQFRRREVSRGSSEFWAYRRCVTGCASKHCSIGWSPSSTIFDEANFGYRRGHSTKDAMRKVWKEIKSGREWIVDADLKDFFGSVDHEKLLTLVAQ